MSGNYTLKKVTAGLLAFVLAAGMMPVSAESFSKDGAAVVAVTAVNEKEETEIWSGKGKGTKAEPYQITSSDEWKKLAEKVNEGESFSGKYFKLTKDITVTEMIGKNEHPTETVSRPFSGIFDGNGHTLTVKIDESEKEADKMTHCAAPFCGVKDAVIKNFTVNGSVKSGIHSAGVVGAALGTLEIENVQVNAEISGGTHNGGLVGHSYGTAVKITNCGFNGTVKASDVACGLIGWCGDNGNVTVTNCLIDGKCTEAVSIDPVAAGTSGKVTIKNTYSTFEAVGANNLVFTGEVKKVSDITAPVAVEELVYDEEEHELITAGSVKDAKMVYSLSVDGNYTRDLPKVKDAGDYEVWYKLEGMGNCTAKFVKVTVERADIEPTVSVANWAFGDEPSVPVVDGNKGEGEVKFEYKSKDAEDSEYTDKVPTEVGNYTLRATIAETQNFKGAEALADFTLEIKYTWHDAAEASCDKDGNTGYFDGSDGKFYVFADGAYQEIEKDSWKVPATGHTYGDPEWKFTADYRTAIASFKCEDCGHVENVKTLVTSKIKDATCTEEGKAVYSAMIEFNGKKYTETKEIVLPAVGHSYTKTEWIWNKNASGATVNVICEKCGDVKTGKAEISVKTINPTYNAEGKKIYTATATIDGVEYTDVRTITISKLSTATELSYEAGNGSAVLSWTPVASAEKYAVCAYISGTWHKLDEVDGTSYEFKGLNPGTVYRVAVIAYANGSWSTDVSNWIGVACKSKFPGVDVEVSHKRFKLTWTPVEGAERYAIGAYINGEWKILAREDGDVTSVISPEFESGTYKMVVCARINGEWDLRKLESRTFEVTID
ncbi:fibronectin type III domain-containing protein [Ruminococcus albus]|uniref:Fibronectin type-III domain-containing protein n=1 Tax=Ruminococcus albus TaxID=1264 RepID=A0A1H7LRZ6_RUMAL|nr:fibronectin type III domain-containing protein [Ruminococcus albus]SEL01235.1 hypothetical protein SAMN05216469_109118 [Ruminococcus albus]